MLGICLASDTSGHQGTNALGSPSLLQSSEWYLTSDPQEQPRKPAPRPLPRRTPEATGHICDLEDSLLPFKASVFLMENEDNPGPTSWTLMRIVGAPDQVLSPVPDLVSTAQIVPILFSDKLDSLAGDRDG